MADSNEDSMESNSVTRHKIIFVGDAGVGKTTIISRIMDNPFNEVYEPSIGVDFMSKNINVKLYKMNLNHRYGYILM